MHAIGETVGLSYGELYLEGRRYMNRLFYSSKHGRKRMQLPVGLCKALVVGVMIATLR